MDGVLPQIPGTPAPSAGFPQGSGYPAGMPGASSVQPPRPPGRPPGDPQVAQDKAERHAEMRRLEEILPKKATDSKISIYRTRNGRVMPGAKPVLTILASELEAAVRDNNENPDEFIAARIEQSVRNPDGTFQCQVFDKQGRRVTNIQPWEVALGDEAVNGEDDGGDDQGEGDDGSFQDDDIPPGFNGQMAAGGQVYSPAQIPPPAPMADPTRIAAALREERETEAKRGGDMLAVVSTLMQSSQQQAQSQQTSMQQMMLQFQTMQIQMAEQSRKEAAERAEREQTRSSEFRNTIITLLPTIIPLVQGLFKREDPTLPVLIELLKNKPSDAAVMPAVMAMMTETMKASSQMQSNAASQAMEQQAKVTGTVTDMMMSRMVEMSKLGGGEPAKEKGIMDHIGELAPLIGPLLAAQQNQNQQPVPALPAPAPEDSQEAEAQVVEQPRRRRRASAPPVPAAAPAAPAPAQRQDPRTMPPESRVLGCMRTIAKMSLGQIVPAKRWEALNWCLQVAPPNMLAAIKAGNRDAVLGIGMGPVAGDAGLVQWFGNPRNTGFLETALSDMRLILTSSLTEARAKAAIVEQEAFVAQSAAPAAAAPAQAQEAAPAAPGAPATPAEGPADAPVLARAQGAKVETFVNTSGATTQAPAEKLSDGGWRQAQPVSVTDGGALRGPVMEENDASWVIMVSADTRIRVPKDKFARRRARRVTTNLSEPTQEAPAAPAEPAAPVDAPPATPPTEPPPAQG